jgi:putative transposase
MPRRARLLLDGVAMHLIQRGNNRSACFFANDDYLFYLDTLAELCDELRIRLHAYCLMTNHVHLLLTPEAGESVSALMKHLGQRYVQHVNRRYRRSGTLWEGRFKSSLVSNDSYLLACYRYIELNPVRAGMVKHPAEYRWSSYRYNAQRSLGQRIQPHQVYLTLGNNAELRKAAYRELFRNALPAGLVDELRSAIQSGYPFGNERFQREIEAATGRRVRPGKAGRPAGIARY